MVKVSVDESQNNCFFYVFFDQVNDNDAMRIALSAYHFPCKNEDEDIIIKSSDLGSKIVSSSFEVVMIYNQKENLKASEVGSIYLCKIDYQLEQLNIIDIDDEMSFVATLTDCKGGVCDKCNKVFYKKENLSSHKRLYHSGGTNL